jgi:hypothetical protein
MSDREAGTDGESPLEVRYRRVLRLLPPAYRAVWADEMIATFLDGMQAGGGADDPDWPEFVAEHGRPSWSEVASVAALAVRLRLGADGGPARYVAWGRALRLAALIGLFAWAVGGLADSGMLLWMSGRMLHLPRPPAEWVAIVASFGPLTWVFRMAALLWVAAFVALVTGHRRAAQVLAPMAVLPEAVRPVLRALGLSSYGGVGPLTWYVLGLSAVIATLPAAFHRGAPAVRAMPWLLALPGAAAVVALAQVVGDAGARSGWPLAEWPGLLCVAFTGAAVGSLTATRLSQNDRWGALSHALALLAPLLLGYRLVTMWPTLQYHYVAPPIAETVAVAVAGAALAIATAGTLRRLPKPADQRWAPAVRGRTVDD